MQQQIRKIVQGMNRVLEGICVVLLACIVVAAVLQVFTRKVMGNSMVGTEEFARYCFIWMSCMGASLCLTNGSHASVSIVKDRLKGKGRHWHGIFCHLIVMIVCYVMIRYGWELLGIVSRQSSPTIGIPMNYVYGALPISCVCMMISALARIIEEIASIRDKGVIE